MPDSQSGKTGGGTSGETGDKIDRIRDILLGGSLDEFSVRLGQLEGRLQSLDSSLREEIERCYNSLDSTLTGQREERVHSEAELNRKLSDEVGALRKELARVRSEVQSSMEAALSQLQATKVDRAALAHIMLELSSQLVDEGSPAAARSEPHE